MVIIGCPVHNDLEAFRNAISTFMNSTQADYKIVIIESESTDGTKEYCDELAKNPKIEVIHTKREGPLKAYNQLFQIAKERGEDLLLIQTDVTFFKLYKRDWLNEMIEIAKDERIGAVVTINYGGISGPDYLDGFKWIGGWCSYITNRAIQKVGGFDENYPKGWGVDIDLTYAILNAGLHIFKLDYWVEHHMSNERLHDTQNFEENEKAKKEAGKYFRNKWGIK
jgi:GT2 family glycosyltransferase